MNGDAYNNDDNNNASSNDDNYYNKLLQLLSIPMQSNIINTQLIHTPPLNLCARKTVPIRKSVNNEVTRDDLNLCNDVKPNKISRCIKSIPSKDNCTNNAKHKETRCIKTISLVKIKTCNNNIDHKETRCIKTIPLIKSNKKHMKTTCLKKKRLRKKTKSSQPNSTHKSPSLNHKEDLFDSKSSLFSSNEISDFNNCYICNWQFPNTMILEEKEAHLNKCLDNEGYIDKTNYSQSISKAKSIEQVFISEISNSICPFCFKAMPKNKKIHMKRCSNKLINN